MNIKQLKERLDEYPDDMRLVRRGYEGGYSDIDDLVAIGLKLNKNTAWFYGPHEISTDVDEFALLID
ncbi:hypothetical protein b3_0066 [Synechococcus phage B3]|nr:hypothetical protein b3_0066 [Synechococcus phage B3]QGT54684.1 hypothetical protein b23_0066 [Synechococcus phage B23]